MADQKEKAPLSGTQKAFVISTVFAVFGGAIIASAVTGEALGVQNQSAQGIGVPDFRFFGYPFYLTGILLHNILIWHMRYGNVAGIDTFFHSGWIFFWVSFFAILIPSFFGLRSFLTKISSGKKTDTTYGSSRFATEEDLQKFPLLTPADPRVVIGAVPKKLPSKFNHAEFLRESERSQGVGGPETDQEKTKYESNIRLLYNNTPSNILVFAPTRSGKGVGFVIPTLLEWSHCTVVLDIKGENYHFTSGYRKQIGQRVLRFKPSDINSNRVSKYNPLEEIRDQTAIAQASEIAGVLADPDGTATKDFWFTSSSDLLTALILFVRYRMFDKSILVKRDMTKNAMKIFLEIPWDSASLGTVAAMISSPLGKDHSEWMQIIIEMTEFARKKYVEKHKGRPIPEYFSYIIRQATTVEKWPMDQASGTLGHAKNHMSLFSDPTVAANTGASDWTCMDLMGTMENGKPTPVSLYLIVNPGDEFTRMRPLLRIIVSQIVSTLTGEMTYDDSGNQKTKGNFKLLMMLDEFPQLGKLKAIEDAMAFTAGYGIFFCLIVQDSVQLDNIYTDKNSIVSNCHIKIVYAPNRPETAKLISEMIGQTTIVKELSSYSKGNTPITVNESRSTSLYQRNLLTADEVTRIPFVRSVIMMANAFPIYGTKVFFYAIRKYIDRSALPEAIPYVAVLSSLEDDGQPGGGSTVNKIEKPNRLAMDPTVRKDTVPAKDIESERGSLSQNEDDSEEEMNFGSILEQTVEKFVRPTASSDGGTKSQVLLQLERLKVEQERQKKTESISAIPLADENIDQWARVWIEENKRTVSNGASGASNGLGGRK